MILLVTMCTATAIFAGCGEQLPDMTKEQEALVTEYAAGLLLKYDDSFDNGILSAKELEIAEAKENGQRTGKGFYIRFCKGYLKESILLWQIDV